MDGLRALLLASDGYRDAAAAHFNLTTTDTLAMGRVAEQGPTPSAELARQLRMAPSSVTALVDRLVNRGYLNRVRDPDDRRKVMVEVTPDGLAVLEWGREHLRRALLELDADSVVLATSAMKALAAAFDVATTRVEVLSPKVPR